MKPRSDKRSIEAQGYRRWYKQVRWIKKAKRQLQHEPLCGMCSADGMTTAATVADHVTPHRGDPEIFWNGELQSLCGPHHSSRKAKIEKRGYHDEISTDGMPTSAAHPFVKQPTRTKARVTGKTQGGAILAAAREKTRTARGQSEPVNRSAGIFEPGLKLTGKALSRVKRAKAELDSRPARKLPWQKRGLTRAARVIAFLEFLPITKGPLAGKSMKLLPGQERFVRRLYDDLRDDGTRRKRLGIKSEPKGNGKTGLVAGLCLAHLLGPEAEPRGEIYSAAIDRQQAAIIYAEMEAIITVTSEFSARCNLGRHFKRIEVLEGDGAGSVYEALSADARRAHGLAPSLFAYDELAQAKDRTLLDNLIAGLGKRKEALGIIISTQAPDDDHPLSQMIDDGLSGANESIYVELAAADPEADPFAEETWFACNEALGKFLSLDEMREAADRAQRIPAFEASFRNLRLNQRVDAAEEERIVPAQAWQACSGAIDVEKLKGKPCYGGLDLSSKNDLSALVLVFPDGNAGYSVMPFFWHPLGQLEARRPAERDLFRTWTKQGFMIGVPGPVVRYRVIAEHLAALRKRFDVKEIAYDRWGIEQFKEEMSDIGETDAPLLPFGQGYQSMSPAVAFFQELVLTEHLRHDGNPVLTSNIASAVITTDPSGNRKPDKQRTASRGSMRIDGLVALLMALGVARGEKPKEPPTYQILFV